MVGGTTALMTQDAQGMGIVHHDVGVVLLGQFHHTRQWNNVTFHREDTIGHNELDRLGSAKLQLGFKGIHIVMVVFPHLTERQATTFDNRGMVEAVQKQVVVSATEGRHHTEIDLETRAETDGCFLAHQIG